MATDSLWYELRNSVYLKEYARAEELLATNPELLTLTNSIGETVLHFLAVENDIEGVAWLHVHGSSLNTETGFGKPMIFEVAELGYKDLLLWLWIKGADFSVLDQEGHGIYECLLDGLHLELLDPGIEDRAKVYWRQREETIRFLTENIAGISMNHESQVLLSALSAHVKR